MVEGEHQLAAPVYLRAVESSLEEREHPILAYLTVLSALSLTGHGEARERLLKIRRQLESAHARTLLAYEREKNRTLFDALRRTVQGLAANTRWYGYGSRELLTWLEDNGFQDTTLGVADAVSRCFGARPAEALADLMVTSGRDSRDLLRRSVRELRSFSLAELGVISRVESFMVSGVALGALREIVPELEVDEKRLSAVRARKDGEFRLDGDRLLLKLLQYSPGNHAYHLLLGEDGEDAERVNAFETAGKRIL